MPPGAARHNRDEAVELPARADGDLAPQKRLGEAVQPARREADAAKRLLPRAVLVGRVRREGELVEDHDEDVVDEAGRHNEEDAARRSGVSATACRAGAGEQDVPRG